MFGCCAVAADAVGWLLTGDAPGESLGGDLVTTELYLQAKTVGQLQRCIVAGAVFSLGSHVRLEASLCDERHDQCDGDVDDQNCITSSVRLHLSTKRGSANPKRRAHVVTHATARYT